MGTEANLLPMDISSLVSDDRPSSNLLQDDPFLQELMNSQQNIDFLNCMRVDAFEEGQSPPEAPPINFDCLLNFPASPVGSEGYTSEASSSTNCNRLDSSPVASLVSSTGGSGSERHQSCAESPPLAPLLANHSPLSMSGFPADPSQWSPASSDASKRNSGSDISSWSASLPPGVLTVLDSGTNLPPSSDVKIDVDSLAVATPPSPPISASPSDRKAATLVLSDEEKRLLSEEGIALPTDMPLTKAEQKQLKRIQRKIKNKISAHESRKRKKEYVEGLEERVRLSTERNQSLTKEVGKLQTENKSLLEQLKSMQEMVASFFPSKLQAGTAGTMLLVVVLSFSLFVLPNSNIASNYQVASGYARKSRSLLFTETDQFGNVVDPDTGMIISVVGGHTPRPLPPWLEQTPAILKWMNTTTLTNTARNMFNRVSFGT